MTLIDASKTICLMLLPMNFQVGIGKRRAILQAQYFVLTEPKSSIY
jgi:hypothetical protein